MNAVSSIIYAAQAQSEKYTGVPYSKLDCQAFVEQVLKDCGVRKPDGSIYNWRGSNSMWRNALSWKGTLAECITRFGSIPAGSWVFIVKNDGGEKDRGYHDDQGNASHVGIYCGTDPDPVRDSTKTKKRDGVGYRQLEGFTHVGLPSMIDFSTQDLPGAEKCIHIIRDPDSSDAEVLNALKLLTIYLKG